MTEPNKPKLTNGKFPTRREDGSFTVSVRFSVSDANSLDEITDQLDKWLRKKTDDRIDLMRDLIHRSEGRCQR
jgi:hypothetical protein